MSTFSTTGIVQDAYDKKKHELDGVKYDHVIDVDATDGQEPLKLGCNKEDDPWVVAQEFISKNLLSQVRKGWKSARKYRKYYFDQENNKIICEISCFCSWNSISLILWHMPSN